MLIASVITPKILSTIPNRAADATGKPGDVVNIMIVGSEEELKLTFRAAQWTVVDRTTTPEKKEGSPQNPSVRAYLDMPLTEQFLFGKPQDYGFVYPELVTIYQTRRFLRLWKAPFPVADQRLWVGAVAHDDGPWWNTQTDEIVTQPNPNLDAERTFAGESLNSTGLVTQLGYVNSPAGPISAGPFRTDGRVLVMILTNLPAQ